MFIKLDTDITPRVLQGIDMGPRYLLRGQPGFSAIHYQPLFQRAIRQFDLHVAQPGLIGTTRSRSPSHPTLKQTQSGAIK